MAQCFRHNRPGVLRNMEEIVRYRRGNTLCRTPDTEAEPIRLILAPGVVMEASAQDGADRFYRLAGTVGLDLQTALDAGWCRISHEVRSGRD